MKCIVGDIFRSRLLLTCPSWLLPLHLIDQSPLAFLPLFCTNQQSCIKICNNVTTQELGTWSSLSLTSQFFPLVPFAYNPHKAGPPVYVRLAQRSPSALALALPFLVVYFYLERTENKGFSRRKIQLELLLPLPITILTEYLLKNRQMSSQQPTSTEDSDMPATLLTSRGLLGRCCKTGSPPPKWLVILVPIALNVSQNQSTGHTHTRCK